MLERRLALPAALSALTLGDNGPAADAGTVASHIATNTFSLTQNDRD
jgi:hypothetical protein